MCLQSSYRYSLVPFNIWCAYNQVIGYALGKGHISIGNGARKWPHTESINIGNGAHALGNWHYALDNGTHELDN